LKRNSTKQPETSAGEGLGESFPQGTAREGNEARRPGSLRRLLRKIPSALQRFLFGDDVFISYSRRDASDYALALAAKLTQHKLSCFLDQWGTRPGNELPKGLVTSLKRSTIMVLLGTPGAAQSVSVAEELELFLRTGRSIIPISFAGALERTDYYRKIEGLAVFADSEEALQTGAPPDALVDRIVNAEGFTSRAKRLRQIFWATAAVVVLLVAGGAAIASYYAQRANEQRRASRLSRLTSESIVALKQERNATKAHAIASKALEIDSTNVQAWGAMLDARYSQIYNWSGNYYSVPFSKTFALSGILGAADLSGDGKTLAAGSWDPYLARIWSIDGRDTLTLTGFTGAVWKIQFSPNDSLLLVAAKTGSTRIYNRKAEVCSRLPIADRILNTAEFSPDSRQVITGFEDGTAVVWDALTGTEVLHLAIDRQARLTSASFSPDGKRILTSYYKGVVIVWDKKGNVLVKIAAGPEPVNAAVFSSDRGRIVTASNSGVAKIWDKEGKQLASIDHIGHRWTLNGYYTMWHSVLGASWSPCGQFLVTYSNYGKIKLTFRGSELLQDIDAHDGRIIGARFSTSSPHLISYGDDKCIKLWRSDGMPLLTLGGFNGPVLEAGFSRDGTLVYGSSWDGTARVFPLEEHPITTYAGQTGISRVEITPDGNKVLSVSTAGKAILWQRDGALIKTIEPKAGWLYDIDLTTKGDVVFIRSDSGGVLWDMIGLEWREVARDSAITCAEFFPDGERLLTGSVDRALGIWNRKGELLEIIGHCTSPIRDMDISSDGERIAAALDSGRIEIWSALDRRKLWQGPYHNQEPVNSIRFSNSGDLIVSAGSGDYRAILCDADGNILNVLRHSADVQSADFSGDDKFILTYSADGMAKLWSREGVLQAEMRTTSSVNRAVLSKDSRFIATASNDGKVRLWDIAGTLLSTFPTGDRRVNWIDLSEEGDWLVSCSSDGLTFGWDLRIQNRGDSITINK
jgi:WD40 repeat protein